MHTKESLTSSHRPAQVMGAPFGGVEPATETLCLISILQSSSIYIHEQTNNMTKLKKSRKIKREVHIVNHITIDYTTKSETTASMA